MHESSSSLKIYGSDATLLQTIKLPSEIYFPKHAVKTSVGNFILLYMAVRRNPTGVDGEEESDDDETDDDEEDWEDGDTEEEDEGEEDEGEEDKKEDMDEKIEMEENEEDLVEPGPSWKMSAGEEEAVQWLGEEREGLQASGSDGRKSTEESGVEEQENG